MGGVLLPSEPSNERMSAYAHARRALAESPKGLPLDDPAIERQYDIRRVCSIHMSEREGNTRQVRDLPYDRNHGILQFNYTL